MANSSVLRTVGKAFLGSMFGIFGVAIGLIIIFIILGGLLGGGKGKEVVGRYKVLPDANGRIEKLARRSPLVLQINIAGMIGGERMKDNDVADILARSQQGALEGRIKAILLNINSGGGAVFDSDNIYRMVKAYKERYQVPVYAYTDGACASGAFYIACAAEKLYATPASIIGSVGVYSTYPNFTGTMEKVGAQALTLKAGKGKASLSPWSKWSDDEGDQMQQVIDYFYDVFVGIVTLNRPKVTKDALINTYGAKVFPAPEALQNGYIDGIVDTNSKVIADLAQEAGIGDGYQVLQLEERSWVEMLFKSAFKIDHQVVGLEKPSYLYE